nr:UDP-glycosyltransferase 91D1 [Ipomoea batatas]
MEQASANGGMSEIHRKGIRESSNAEANSHSKASDQLDELVSGEWKSNQLGGPVKCSGLGRRLPDLNSSGDPRYANVAAVYTLRNAVGTPYLFAISGTQCEAKSTRINSGKSHLRSSSNGGAILSYAIFKNCTCSCCSRSTVASQFSGKPGTEGNVISLRLNLSVKLAGIGGNLCRFLGVDTKETLKPLAANFLANSSIGSIWPNANHGNIIT